jgi:hypothetical protein
MARMSADTAVAEATNGTVQGEVERPERAYELTDAQGRQALVWWGPDKGWVVEAKDPSFRRRVRRAFNRPLWVFECVFEPDGGRSCYRTQLEPSDARHPLRIPGNWHQLRLNDVAVRVVAMTDREPSESAASAASRVV